MLNFFNQVILIMCFAGHVSPREFCYMKLEDIEDHGSMIYIKVPVKNAPSRSFTISNISVTGCNYLELFRKYSTLRPSHAENTRFFVQYFNGKCTTHVVGIHTFVKIPRIIAEFLKLSDIKSYTGHCLKATAVALKLDFQRGLIGYYAKKAIQPTCSAPHSTASSSATQHVKIEPKSTELVSMDRYLFIFICLWGKNVQ